MRAAASKRPTSDFLGARLSAPFPFPCRTETCAGYPGSLGKEEQDAKQFATWGVDFLKACISVHRRTVHSLFVAPPPTEPRNFRHGANSGRSHSFASPSGPVAATGGQLLQPCFSAATDSVQGDGGRHPRHRPRHLLLHLRVGAAVAVRVGPAARQQARRRAHELPSPGIRRASYCRSSSRPHARKPPASLSWRTTADITTSWDDIMNIADENEPWWRAAGPGGWNDPGTRARSNTLL